MNHYKLQKSIELSSQLSLQILLQQSVDRAIITCIITAIIHAIVTATISGQVLLILPTYRQQKCGTNKMRNVLPTLNAACIKFSNAP